MVYIRQTEKLLKCFPLFYFQCDIPNYYIVDTVIPGAHERHLYTPYTVLSTKRLENVVFSAIVHNHVQGHTNNKAKPHNTPKVVIYQNKNKLPQVGFEPTTLLHSRQKALPYKCTCIYTCLVACSARIVVDRGEANYAQNSSYYSIPQCS